MRNKDGLVSAFFCVPDITGFTKFIATADAQYAREVIPALLRRIIEANLLGMNIGEIEGDAIFFYKTGRLPGIKKVAKQCCHIYKVFRDYLVQLEKDDPVNYSKFLANDQLGMKIIVHTGKISVANIKGRTKLLGEDVIIAHKLLKNEVQEFNYVLLTENYLSKVKDEQSIAACFNWNEIKTGKEVYDYIGEVGYSYIPFDDQ